ncbi:MAG: hypothetical protein ACOX81_00785 [Candidatus Heteroscillospira sp.]|jgi:hypothetical protein
MKKLGKMLQGYFMGILSAVLSISLVTAVMAAGGSVSLSDADISVLNSHTIKPGDTFITENGEKAPASITYTDDKGGNTLYVPIREFAYMLNAPIGWDKETGVAHFAEPEYDSPVNIETGVIELEPIKLSETPEIGRKIGSFTEVQPSSDELKLNPMSIIDEAEYSSRTGWINQEIYVFPPYGNYIEIEITNHGEPVGVYVAQPYFVTKGGAPDNRQFTPVELKKDESIVRAFMMDDDVDYARRFLLLTVDRLLSGAEYYEAPPADITVNITQYQLIEN